MQYKEFLRNNCPQILMLRRIVSKIRIKVLEMKMLPRKEISKGENNILERKSIVEKYNKRWPNYYNKAIGKIEDLFQRAPAYQNRSDLEDIKINMLFFRYAYGFLPEEYLCFGLEGKKPDEYKEFVSDIERIKYDCQMSDMADSSVFKDKTRTYNQFKNFYKRDAIAVMSMKDYGSFEKFVQKHPIFVKKEVFESLGRGTELVDIRELKIPLKEYYKKLISKGKHMLEEKVCQSAIMSRLNESSVNTIRCITFNTKNGIVIPYCFMKVGRKGAFVDNGGAGGILIGIDNCSGRLVTDGINEFGEVYSEHPDSNVKFIGYQLPEWNQMIEMCKEMSKQVPTVGYIGWDMAHTDNGWVVIEGNNCGQMIGPQMIWHKGIKAEIRELMHNMKLLT